MFSFFSSNRSAGVAEKRIAHYDAMQEAFELFREARIAGIENRREAMQAVATQIKTLSSRPTSVRIEEERAGEIRRMSIHWPRGHRTFAV